MADRMPYFFTFTPVPQVESHFRLLNETECVTDDSKDLAYEIAIQILVALTVSGISSVVDYDEFKASFRKPPIYAGACFQFFLMPFIGFLAVFIFPLKTLEAISLIILCASPGGSFSNWWCNLFNADLALSVSMTSLSTVAAIGMLPLNILLYVTLAYERTKGSDADGVEIDFTTLGITLGVVISSIILGLTFGIKYPHLQPYSNLVGNVAGLGSIILGLFATTDTCPGEGPPWQQPFFPLWVGTAFPLLVGLIGTFILSGLLGLKKQQRVAIALETAYQNTGIALAYALSQGPEGRAAAGVPVIYGGYEAGFFGLFMLVSWKLGWTYAPPDYNIFKVMIENFQPGSENYAKFFPEEAEALNKAEAKVDDAVVVADPEEVKI